MESSSREGYRFLEHVTDAFIEAWGETFETALAQAGLAFFDTITDTGKVQPKVSVEIAATGHDELELLYNWLEELLLKFEIDQLAFSRFQIETVTHVDTGFRVSSKAWGETFDRVRHSRKVEVKGVTYHLMSVDRTIGKTTLRFILDL